MRWPARKSLRWLLASLAIALVVLVAGCRLARDDGSGARVDRCRTRVAGWNPDPRRRRDRAIDRAAQVHEPRHRASARDVRISGFEADYEPLEILAGRISAEGVRIDEASIRLQPRESPSRPPSFMPGWLTVVVDDAAIARFLIVSPGGVELPLSDIRGSAKLSKTEIEFDGVQVDAPAWAVAGASGNLVARSPLAMNVNAAWSLSGDRLDRGYRACGRRPRPPDRGRPSREAWHRARHGRQ